MTPEERWAIRKRVDQHVARQGAKGCGSDAMWGFHDLYLDGPREIEFWVWLNERMDEIEGEMNERNSKD